MHIRFVFRLSLLCLGKIVFPDWGLLTHLCLVESSTSSLWRGPIPVERSLVSFFLLLPCFIEIPVFYANSVDPDQTPRLWRLIWICTVCQCSFYGTLGLDGLMGIFSFVFVVTEKYNVIMHQHCSPSVLQ